MENDLKRREVVKSQTSGIKIRARWLCVLPKHTHTCRLGNKVHCLLGDASICVSKQWLCRYSIRCFGWIFDFFIKTEPFTMWWLLKRLVVQRNMRYLLLIGNFLVVGCYYSHKMMTLASSIRNGYNHPYSWWGLFTLRYCLQIQDSSGSWVTNVVLGASAWNALGSREFTWCCFFGTIT